MKVRIALLYGCYLISLDREATRLRLGESVYYPGDLLPVMTIQYAPPAVTAREFVRQSMLLQCGVDDRGWPKLAKRFIEGAAGMEEEPSRLSRPSGV